MTKHQKVLVTGGRFMPVTGLIHALHRAGAEVHVADHDGIAPGMHARMATPHLIGPPAQDPVGFAKEIGAICKEHDIDLVIGGFEDSFFLARYREHLPVPLFAPDFSTIEQLHNKAAFVGHCQDLGLTVPRTEIVTSQADLKDAVEQFDIYFARPAFSRGGAKNMTNFGSHAGARAIEDCHPTEENPWLVQEFVEGDDTCALGIARDGKLELVGAYEPVIAASGGFSVRFGTVDPGPAVDFMQKICTRFNYTGLIGFDYRRTPDGPVLIECNPRLTAGAFLIEEELLGRTLIEGLDELFIVPPGRSKQYDCYVLNRHVSELTPAAMLRATLSAPDALISQRDVMPFLYTFVYAREMTKRAMEHHVELCEVSMADLAWDGAPLPPD